MWSAVAALTGSSGCYPTIEATFTNGRQRGASHAIVAVTRDSRLRISPKRSRDEGFETQTKWR
jgi:hypothetical protein